MKPSSLLDQGPIFAVVLEPGPGEVEGGVFRGVLQLQRPQLGRRALPRREHLDVGVVDALLLLHSLGLAHRGVHRDIGDIFIRGDLGGKKNSESSAPCAALSASPLTPHCISGEEKSVEKAMDTSEGHRMREFMALSSALCPPSPQSSGQLPAQHTLKVKKLFIYLPARLLLLSLMPHISSCKRNTRSSASISLLFHLGMQQCCAGPWAQITFPPQPQCCPDACKKKAWPCFCGENKVSQDASRLWTAEFLAEPTRHSTESFLSGPRRSQIHF